MKLTALNENTWVLGPKSYNRVSLSKPRFWTDNTPAIYKDYKLTDPRIPKDTILKIAKKHPNGLQGARSAIQSLINMGSAKGASMRRLRQIGSWLSKEIKSDNDKKTRS